MALFKLTKRCPYCAGKLDKNGKCACDVFKAVEEATNTATKEDKGDADD